MRNKEFREVQVSSSGLVFIFLAILVLGVFIFLLGVSVGKKQVQMASPTTLLARPATETVSGDAPAVLKESTYGVDAAAGSELKPDATSPAAERMAEIPPVTQKPAPRTTAPEPVATKPVETKSTPAATSGTYYIQVGAFNERSQADTFAARFKELGYPALVLKPFSTDKRATYRVRLVGYMTKDQASQALAKLNAATTKRTGYYIRRED